MTWRDLCFLHWPVKPTLLRGLHPGALELDTFDGEAWLGVVPFEMRRTRFRAMPPVPTATHFPELNLRTYVTHRGRPGVWFFSLDAASRLAVRGARSSFALPYFDARMDIDRTADTVRFTSERLPTLGAPPATFEAAYRPSGEASESTAGSLEHFLTERYSLYAQRGFGVPRALRGGLVRGDIVHPPWRLTPGECELRRCDMFRLLGASVAGRAPLVHLAESVDVVAHAPLRVAGR